MSLMLELEAPGQAFGTEASEAAGSKKVPESTGTSPCKTK